MIKMLNLTKIILITLAIKMHFTKQQLADG